MKISLEKYDVFNIYAQNIDCRYMLEPPRQGGSNEYPQSIFWIKIRKIVYPSIPQIHTINVGFKGVFIAWTLLHDET